MKISKLAITSIVLGSLSLLSFGGAALIQKNLANSSTCVASGKSAIRSLAVGNAITGEASCPSCGCETSQNVARFVISPTVAALGILGLASGTACLGCAASVVLKKGEKLSPQVA